MSILTRGICDPSDQFLIQTEVLLVVIIYAITPLSFIHIYSNCMVVCHMSYVLLVRHPYSVLRKYYEVSIVINVIASSILYTTRRGEGVLQSGYPILSRTLILQVPSDE